jgi:hypothetical protein
LARKLLSEILKKTASMLVEAEVNYPALNIPTYQDRENGPQDNAGGAYGLSEPYIERLMSPSHEVGQKHPKEYSLQGERPENDADFYTEYNAAKQKRKLESEPVVSLGKELTQTNYDSYAEPYSSKKKKQTGVPYLSTTVPFQNDESPKDGYKGPGYHETFNHGQGDPNPGDLDLIII